MASVLYVDDDKDHRFIFQECLKEARPGVECLLAENAHRAISILKELSTPPICIFIDMIMPLTDGLETLAMIKANTSKSIATYIFSASPRPAYEQKALELGADGFLIKPEGFEPFCTLLDRLIPNEVNEAN